ncbi:hypothetical protein ACFOPN_08795 [Xanthomonas hyacinthi]
MAAVAPLRQRSVVAAAAWPALLRSARRMPCSIALIPCSLEAGGRSGVQG